MSKIIHDTAAEHGFWSASRGPSILSEKICLIHSEASEVLEAMREDNWEKVPEELADIIIRVLDLAGHLGYDMDSVVKAKMEKNKGRPKLHNKKF